MLMVELKREMTLERNAHNTNFQLFRHNFEQVLMNINHHLPNKYHIMDIDVN